MKQFYVSTNGDDKNIGSIEKPFKTLNASKLAARSHINDDVEVVFRSGKYTFTKTELFGLEDGVKDRVVTYKAMDGEKVIFSSGASVNNFKPYEGQVAKEAEGKVWVADISNIIEKRGLFHTLYENDILLKRSRSAGFTPTGEAGQFHMTKEHYYSFNYDDRAPFSQWDNIEDIEIYGRSAAAWHIMYLPLESVDTKSKTVHTAIPGKYPLTKVRADINHPVTMWIENSVEFITKPGNWAVNTKTGKLFLWPMGNKPEGIEVPMLTEFIRIEGDIDFEGDVDIPVCGIEFEGIKFVVSERDVYIGEDHHGLDLQHTWDFYDKANAVVRFRGAENCCVKNCKFIGCGGTAIRLDLHCRYNDISGNYLENIGGTGILLAGYGAGNKDVNAYNTVSNNYINNPGVLFGHSVGIFLWQSGNNRVANNLVHNTPYIAIVVSGRIIFEDPEENTFAGDCHKTIRWQDINIKAKDYVGTMPFLHCKYNVIENNDISNCMTFLGDGNCIYISGTGINNVVRYNYMHHCSSLHMGATIRCDDNQDKTSIYGNVINRVNGMGCAFMIKGVNDIYNNVHYCPTHFSESYKNSSMLTVSWVCVDGSYISNNIFVSENDTVTPCGRQENNNPKQSVPRPKYIKQPEIKGTMCENNVWFNSSDEKWADEYLQNARADFLEFNTITDDPMFIDPENGDFRLNPESPALKLGFRQIDNGKIGLTSAFSYPYENIPNRIYARIGDNPAACTLKVGRSEKIKLNAKTAIGFSAYVGDYEVSYESSDENVAAVDENGIVTAVGCGKCIVAIKLRAGDDAISTIFYVQCR
jgi:hypothetical protein